ncbi:MAG: FAD-dependent oxidoreductase [bacterium]|nr:FAD-dependent oxidoreductase [bacterium]
MAIQEFEAEVISKKYLTKDVIELSFSIPETFDFQAGQFIMLRLFYENVYKFKSYSILNSPSQKGKLDLCIKIIDGGFASEAFKLLNIGEYLTMRGPFGQFTFKDTEKEAWFIGVGTGVTPFYSMLKEYLPKSQKNFRLIFGVRKKEDLFYHEEFQALEKNFSHFSYCPTLSQETWEGYSGRVQKHLGEDLQNKDFYICGLKEMVLETQEYLLKRGVAPERIHFERYS